jgi:hypothetical protein
VKLDADDRILARDMHARPFHVLRQGGRYSRPTRAPILFWAQLIVMTATDLLQYYGIGPTTLKYVRDALERKGLYLAGEKPQKT